MGYPVDVKSTHLTTDGAIFAGPARVLGMGWFGTLTATFLESPVICLLKCIFAGSTSVKAPGQKCLHRIWAVSENSVTTVSTVWI